MAQVRPFRGMRYADRAGAMATLVAPPYDVIEEEARQQLLEHSPHNIVRVDIAAGGYDDAAARWSCWRRDGIIVQEERPAFYAYKQTYKGPDGHIAERLGVIGAVKLAAYDKRIVFPHERTLTGPKADRLQLMRATRTQLSPVFGLHFGAAASVEELLAPALSGERSSGPTMSVVDPDDVLHEMWALTDPGLLQAVTDALQPAQIVIADGHHRYETALAFRDEQRARLAAEGGAATDVDEAAWNYVQMMLVDITSPGLTVFPTHRIVHELPRFTRAGLAEGLGDLFQLSAVDTGANPAAATARALDTLGSTPGFVVYMGTEGMLLARLKDYGTWEAMTPDRAPAWRALDVSVLHELALPKLGLDDAMQSSGEYMTYSHTAQEAIAAVHSGRGGVALLVRPTPSQAVKDVALAGQSMPQKSTYYYPKLLTGLVMSDLDTSVGL